MDDQVTIHGHRVEPAEIERVLCGHPRVQAAVVVPGGPGSRLTAFVEVDGRSDPVPGPLVDELRSYLGSRVPEYMLPARLQVLQELPLTASGKVDRARLASTRTRRPARQPSGWCGPGDADRAAGGRGLVGPARRRRGAPGGRLLRARR
jgi:acyl-coenzyme A synthetase/AMP-(fatty) acid ligase